MHVSVYLFFFKMCTDLVELWRLYVCVTCRKATRAQFSHYLTLAQIIENSSLCRIRFWKTPRIGFRPIILVHSIRIITVCVSEVAFSRYRTCTCNMIYGSDVWVINTFLLNPAWTLHEYFKCILRLVQMVYSINMQRWSEYCLILRTLKYG